MSNYLSYLMGAENIQDKDLSKLNIEIQEKMPTGSRKLSIPADSLDGYLELIKNFLNTGFWNEVVGATEILFIFKYKDGTCRQLVLNNDTESQIDKLCADFNNEPADKTANVYKYLSENDLYHDLMVKHYSNLINR